jgi:hypothetical protein
MSISHSDAVIPELGNDHGATETTPREAATEQLAFAPSRILVFTHCRFPIKPVSRER